MEFRSLRADEIECRIGQVARNGSGLSLLLFKNARTDADVLDEVVGPKNWQCKFYECKGTLFCSVGILVSGGTVDLDNNGLHTSNELWVWKDDAGSPSNMEAQKGEASDAFKRACFKWGIGRELYTAPRIWVYGDKCHIKPGQNGKFQCYDNFSVSSIQVKDHKIEQLEIRNDSNGQVVFQWVSPEYAQRMAEEYEGKPSQEQLVEMTGLVTRIAELRNVSNDVVLKSLMESGPMRSAGVTDGRIDKAGQAATAINQLKVWADAAERGDDA